VALAEAVRYRLGPDAQLALSARAANGTTRLGWSVELDLGADPVGRYAGLAADRLLGPRLEAGLARLARLVERLPPHDVSALDVERHVLAPRPLLRVERPLLDGARPTADAVTSALAAVAVALDGLGERPAGPPVLLWNGSTLSIGVPVTGFGDRATSALPGRVSSGSLPGGEAVRAVHVGPYETLLETHGAVAAWLAVHGLGAGGPQWLVFRDDPAATPREVLRTELWYSLE
jgi:hypothetical protein